MELSKKHSPSDKDVGVIEKAAQAIVTNFDAAGGLSTVFGEIERFTTDTSRREYNLSRAGTRAITVASYLLATGGRQLIEQDAAAGWVSVANGSLAHFLALKTSFDCKSTPAGNFDPRDSGFGLTAILFVAGASLLFPRVIDRADVLRWCELDVDAHEDSFKPDVWNEIKMQFQVAVTALRLESGSDFETRLNHELTTNLGRTFDARGYVLDAAVKHTEMAAQGLRRKHIEFDGFPGFCIFPAHVISLARELVGMVTDGGARSPFLSDAHLGSFPSDVARSHPVLAKLKEEIAR